MKLTPSEITYLARCFDTLSPLSPFANNRQELTGGEEASLTEKGILENGVLSGDASSLLLPLSLPERCARMILQKPFVLLEKYSYLDGERIILAENDGSGLIITPIENGGIEVQSALEGFHSSSSIKNAEINVTLAPSELATLLACIDLTRKKVLSSYIGASQAPLTFTAPDVAAELASAYPNGLVAGVSGNLGVKVPDPETVPVLLVLLEQKGLVMSDREGSCSLAPQFLLFAQNFLVYDSVLLLEAFQVTEEGKLAASLELSYCAGLHDAVSFTLTGTSNVTMHTISGLEMGHMIAQTMSCPPFEV